MMKHITQIQAKKVEEKYWDYIVRCIKISKFALPIEKYSRYIR